jgi:hypothetical protein
MMKRNLVVKLLVAVALIAIAAVVFLALNDTGSAKVVDQPAVGFGDLRRFEAEGFIPGTYTQESPKTYYGMGDLQRLEMLQETQFPE